MKKSMELFTGSKRYSSWSMRPWLLLKSNEIEFNETVIRFESCPQSRELSLATQQQIHSCSTNNKLPALHHGKVVISESLAICEYISDLYPEINGWPQAMDQRALARSLCLEVISGFIRIKLDLPFVGDGRKKNLPTEISSSLNEAIQHLTNRIVSVRQMMDGGGSFGILDAVLTPMILRLNAYGITIDPELDCYSNWLLSTSPVKEWINEAAIETEKISAIEAIFDSFPKMADVPYKL